MYISAGRLHKRHVIISVFSVISQLQIVPSFYTHTEINIQDKAQEHDDTSDQLIQYLLVWCDLSGLGM